MLSATQYSTAASVRAPDVLVPFNLCSDTEQVRSILLASNYLLNQGDDIYVAFYSWISAIHGWKENLWVAGIPMVSFRTSRRWLLPPMAYSILGWQDPLMECKIYSLRCPVSVTLAPPELRHRNECLSTYIMHLFRRWYECCNSVSSLKLTFTAMLASTWSHA